MTSVTGSLSKALLEISGEGASDFRVVRPSSVQQNITKGPPKKEDDGVQRNPVYDALMARFRSFLGEAVLRTDEAGRNVVWERGPYFIAVDNPESPGYLSLWFQGPQKIENVGKMWLVPARESDLKGYAAVQRVDVLPKHRGKGLGQELYRQALKLLGPRYKGLASERIHRKNHGQVPRIWKRLGGRETPTGDFIMGRT